MGRKIKAVNETGVFGKADTGDFFNLFFAGSGCVTEAVIMMEVVEKMAAKKELAEKKAAAGKAVYYG